jgi:tRNA-dihydrouridine synthase
LLSLAPLQGLTDAAFRRIFMGRFPGWGRCYAPFIKGVEGPCAASHFRDLSGQAQAPFVVIPQIVCNRPGELADTAARLANMGFSELNLNFGCPFPMVARKRRGSGILPHPELIDRLLGEGLPRCRLDISIKLRLGRESPEEAGSVLEVLNRYPIKELILHPRTGIQMYSGSPDLDAFAAFRAASRHPVAYNGDILRAEDVLALARRFPGLRHWMIGRGALGNPFLPLELRSQPPQPEARRSALAGFHAEYLRVKVARLGRTRQLLDLLKALWALMARALPGGDEFLVRLRRSKDMDDYEAVLVSFLGSA